MIFYNKLRGANVVIKKYLAIKKRNSILGKLKPKIIIKEKEENQKSSVSQIIKLEFLFEEDTEFRKKWLIYPDSMLKQIWDNWIVFLLFYTASYFAYRTSFYDEITAAQFGFDLFVDICFFSDICLTFFTVT